MIFDPKNAERIVAGRKTVTRRPANGRPCPVRVGSIQKLQPGQGQPHIAGVRLHVTSARLERLDAITVAEARREGHRGRKPLVSFLRSFGERYPGCFAQHPVYRIEFEVVGEVSW